MTRTNRRQLDVDERPAHQIVQVVAELKGCDPMDLPPLYDSVDAMLEGLYNEPPAPEAQLTVAFDYCGYRITAAQDGVTVFIEDENP